MYYRDLFVHKLGSTEASAYFLMLIDGRVVTALGMNDRDFYVGRSKYINEVFGISKSSKRYARLGKLFMLALTSMDFQRMRLSRSPNMFAYEPRGIQTTSITTHPEGKTDRSVMKLHSREKINDNQYRIIYRGDFRDDTWADCIRLWLEKWGGINRG